MLRTKYYDKILFTFHVVVPPLQIGRDKSIRQRKHAFTVVQDFSGRQRGKQRFRHVPQQPLAGGLRTHQQGHQQIVQVVADRILLAYSNEWLIN